MATMTGVPMVSQVSASRYVIRTQRIQCSPNRSHLQVPSTSSSYPPGTAQLFTIASSSERRGLLSNSRGCGGFPSATSDGLGSYFDHSFGGRKGVFATSRNKVRRLTVVAQARKDSIDAPERILAAVGYLLPFFDGIQYGRFFFLQYPLAETLLRPLYPLLAAYKGFPYSNFIAFFSLYLLVVRNQSISRYVRFNAMQAVVLDVLLILPTLVERIFSPRGGFGVQLLIIFYNTVFLFLVACFLFGVFSCLLGKTPRLPIVADAADAQV